MLPLVRVLVAVVMSLALTWVLFVVVLLVARPRGMDLAEAKRLVPDLVRSLRGLAREPGVGRGVRVRLFLLLAYLACPIDLIPDVIPVLGYADDVIIVSLVLRSVVRRAGREALARHWAGSAQGLALVHRLAGVR